MSEPTEPKISNDEVDARLEKVDAGAIAKQRPHGAGVEPYDLVAPDTIVRGRMPGFDRINERWVGELERKIVEIVRRPIEMTVGEVELGAYGEWQAGMPALASLNLFMIKPWGRAALVAVDGNLLFVLVDAYYGGAGAAAERPAREDLSPTERRLNALLAGLFVDEFRRAFEPIASLEFEPQKTETNPHYVQIATSSETVAITRVEVTLGNTVGAMSLVLPASALDPVRDKLSEGLQDVSREVKQRWKQSLRAHLERTELELTSVFLRTELTMRELLRLKSGDILPIEMPKTATLFAGAEPLLSGKFGLSRGYNAISVVESARDAWTSDEKEARA
jgi:flagellar motor switch protein FliM